MSDPRSAAAWATFRKRVAELGGEVLEPKWLGSNTPHRVRCKNNHVSTPKPQKVNAGRGICRTCVGQDPVAAWESFCKRVTELGGEVLETEWRGSGTPHTVRCKDGHFNTPLPCNISNGQGLCRQCAGQDSATAERAFRRRVSEAGGRVVGSYVNCDTPVRVVCAQGHETAPTPYRATRGVVCTACAGLDPVAAEATFHARVATLGGVVVGPYIDSKTRVACICPAGHPCRPTPSYLWKGKGMCPVCARNDPETGRKAFYDRVNALGGRVVGPYVNSTTLVSCVCREGHACRPRPSSLTIGQGLCGQCAGKTWDVFYLTVNPTLRRLKFGVTSGDPRARLGNHHRAGYVKVVRVLPNLPDAHALEWHVRTMLREAGIAAVQGREYFGLTALPFVLNIVDGWATAAA